MGIISSPPTTTHLESRKHLVSSSFSWLFSPNLHLNHLIAVSSKVFQNVFCTPLLKAPGILLELPIISIFKLLNISAAKHCLHLPQQLWPRPVSDGILCGSIGGIVSSVAFFKVYTRPVHCLSPVS